jgi:hypothetical protein
LCILAITLLGLLVGAGATALLRRRSGEPRG